MNRCVGKAHTLTVLSSDADMSMRPFDEKLTLRTVPECAAIVVDLPSLQPRHGIMRLLVLILALVCAMSVFDVAFPAIL